MREDLCEGDSPSPRAVQRAGAQLCEHLLVLRRVVVFLFAESSPIEHDRWLGVVSVVGVVGVLVLAARSQEECQVHRIAQTICSKYQSQHKSYSI